MLKTLLAQVKEFTKSSILTPVYSASDGFHH